jgi:uncharacterized membrane protein (UPF0127 family)
MKRRRHSVRTSLAACFCLALCLAVPARAGELSEYGNPFTTVLVKGVAVKAEVVSSPEKLYLGLSHRHALPPGRGMLFIMPTAEIQQFCMRGMRFAIDIIWIGEGQVAGCQTNIPPDDPRTLTSPVPVKYVLEVPAGFCDTHRITTRDQVTFKLP